MLTILLIEDNDSDAAFIQRAVAQHMKDSTCLHATTLEGGIKTALDKKPDVILLDLGLPDSSGPAETYKRIKECANGIPVIISTSLNDHELAKSLVHDGAEDYLSKDLMVNDPSHVRDSIDFALERHMLFQKMNAEKEIAVKDSQQKDTVLNCFMGGYSIDK